MAENCGATVLVVDDDGVCRELVSTLLGRAGFSTVDATNGEEAMAAARRHLPKLVLLDVRLPDVSGYEICRQLRDEFGDRVAIVFLSGERTEGFDRAAGLLVGADDYVVKPFSADELLARVRLRLPSPVEAEPPAYDLTKRELEVLGLLSAGLSQKEIAAKLVISSKTVAAHVQHILGKLGVHSRTQAVAHAYRRGLLNGVPPEPEPAARATADGP
ncbi:MAG TPA: response regulator transcription factor [Gaiellaceae bacterium]|nr:response regulator transcription factor [Gaiellaceae bacterium]